MEHQIISSRLKSILDGETPANTSTVFAGSDIDLYAIYGDAFVHLGNAHTVSYSVHRDKYPVRRLGRAHAAGYTRGTRTIAGSFVFVNYDSAALHELMKYFLYDSKETAFVHTGVLTDQLPPFDVVMLFRNEDGAASVMNLSGIEIVDEGAVLGVNEAYPETTMQYLARDVNLMRRLPVSVDGSTVAEDPKMSDKHKELIFNRSDITQIMTQSVSVNPDHDDADDPLWFQREIR